MKENRNFNVYTFSLFCMKMWALCIFIPLVSCASTPRRDTEVSAIQGNDYTALIEGCGNQLVPGFTFCRMREGQSAEDKLWFVGPITNCKREFCVEFKIFDPQGGVAYGDAIPKKEFRKGIPWKILLKRDTFEVNDRGYWPFTYRVYWVDKNGNENVSVSEGEIRLKVLRKEYIPLNEVVRDKNFTWEFYTRNREHVKITSGMRTFVSRRK